MCKFNKETLMKGLLFIGGAFVLYKMVSNVSSSEIDIDGQTFKVYGSEPKNT